MPRPESFPPGAPCWVDLFSSDLATATDFYRALLGWTTASAGSDYGGYVNCSKGGLPVAGMMQGDGEAPVHDVWSVYLATDDIARTVEAAGAQGGETLVPAMPVMALGSMAVVTDPGGSAVGAWQAAEHRGFGLLAEPGAPAWFELHTRSYAAAVAFYEKVFGWDAHTVMDTDEMRYTTLGEDDSAAAGITDIARWPDEGIETPGWNVYFGVTDTDAALDRARALGGSVVRPTDDSPYGHLATAADPNGAVFMLHSPA